MISQARGVRRHSIGCAVCTLIVLTCGCPRLVAEDPAPAFPAGSTSSPPFRYWSESRTKPRPLRIHYIKLNLRDPRHELVALITDDPDDNGPAEAVLESPRRLAADHRVIAAVNANAFGPAHEDKDLKADRGTPVKIIGWARQPTREASTPVIGYFNFWITPEGQPRIDNLGRRRPAELAVAGFGELLRNGDTKADLSRARHPRTAIGTDAEGRWLLMVVVDGRRPGVSEGVNVRELAKLMQEADCVNALNLDGGGSSIMLLRDRKGVLQIMNQPADQSDQGKSVPRPIPVMLGVRKVDR